jgi:hypothetical protein
LDHLHETEWGISGGESVWFLAVIGSEDGADIRADEVEALG